MVFRYIPLSNRIIAFAISVLFPLTVYCQSEKPRISIGDIYKTETKRLLMPQSQHIPVVAAFLVHPEVDPDYSICLKDSVGQFFLEMRLLDKNLWYELLTRFMQKQSLTLPIKTGLYSIRVSKRFKKKMLQAFNRVKPIKVDPFLDASFDGITYDFIWTKNGEISKVPITFGLMSESYEYNLINQLALLNSELKKNLFCESNCIRKFNIKRLTKLSKNNQQQQD